MSPTFFAATQYFPYKIAEMLIILIQYQQLLVIEACCFPAQAGSGSPAEAFLSGVAMTVRLWQWLSAAALSEHNKDFFTAPPAIAQIRQRQKERESLANTPFSFCSVFLSWYFSWPFTQDRKVMLPAFYRVETEAQKGKVIYPNFFSGDCQNKEQECRPSPDSLCAHPAGVTAAPFPWASPVSSRQKGKYRV